MSEFLRSGWGVCLMTVLVLVIGAGTIVGYQIHSITHPARARDAVRPGDLLLRADEVKFQSTDGIALVGWLIHGDRDAPVIVMAHDLGGSKAVFLDAAVPLQRAGFNLFAFDFRGHGDSGGHASTLGILERYDVLGAIDMLRARRDVAGSRIGLWGLGMGAYAAVTAAAERPEVTALALDSPYPDISSFLNQVLYRGLPPATTRLTSVASFFYDPYFQWKLEPGALIRLLPQLANRDFLFVAGTSEPVAAAATRALYETLPEGGQADKNLLELERSGLSRLYAEDRRRYEESVTDFFGTYLPVHPDQPAAAIQVEVR
jgi:pimeloyl-ACP methyl ester carboxylesterase